MNEDMRSTSSRGSPEAREAVREALSSFGWEVVPTITHAELFIAELRGLGYEIVPLPEPPK